MALLTMGDRFVSRGTQDQRRTLSPPDLEISLIAPSTVTPMMSTDTAASNTSSNPVVNVKLSPLCERLVNQLMVMQQRDHELLVQNRSLAQCAAEKQTLLDRMESMQAQLHRVESVKNALEEQFKASRQTYQRIVDEDDAKRKALSAELQQRIQEVNVYAERVTQVHAKTLHENAALKEQAELLKQHRATGEGKFDELVKAREQEIENTRERLAKEKAREPLLLEALGKIMELQATVQQEHATWKGKVDEFVSKFDDVQKKLMDAKKTFDAAKEERDRMAQRIAAIEAERTQAIHRAEKARAERDVELIKANELEQKVNAMEAQTKRLLDVYAALAAK